MRVELVKSFFAEAAHTNVRGLHGHSYRLDIVTEGEVDPVLGWLIDYGDIKAAFAPLYAQLDHAHLNETPGMSDTSFSGIRTWIVERLKPALPCLRGVRVSILGDGAFKPVVLTPDADTGLPERLRFTFEAAQSLPHLPPGHPCRRLHGHSYCVEAGAGDMGELHGCARDLYDALDHRFLNDIPGLDAATSERLCRWIWRRIEPRCPDLAVVAVQETTTARCAYYGD
jgi:6-pyruvoyltetrahydropterin/6-carboxytetrahydropterin synthase